MPQPNPVPRKKDTDDDTTVVVIGGKRLTLQEVKNQYGLIAYSQTPVVRRILDIIANSSKPIATTEIMKGVGMTMSYVITILREMRRQGLVTTFKVPSTRQTLYYVLTEKGYEEVSKK